MLGSEVSNLETSTWQQQSITHSNIEIDFSSCRLNVIWFVTVKHSKSCDTSVLSNCICKTISESHYFLPTDYICHYVFSLPFCSLYSPMDHNENKVNPDLSMSPLSHCIFRCSVFRYVISVCFFFSIVCHLIAILLF